MTSDVHDKAGSPRLLITAGPTHEPIDAVRYLGNRSSGKLGCALADEAANRDLGVTLLLGPTHLRPQRGSVVVHPYETTADLDGLLRSHLPRADVLIMAAAVADYRPRRVADAGTKLRREGDGLILDLESTPDLLRGCADRREDRQLLVGFALEPRQGLLDAARRKLDRKGIDLIVANPLETTEQDGIEATLLGAPGTGLEQGLSPGELAKTEFAAWLLDQIVPIARVRMSNDVGGTANAPV